MVNAIQGIEISKVQGDQFSLMRTHEAHFGAGADQAAETGKLAFGSLLTESLQAVNGLQHEASDLAVAAMIKPDEVDAHDVPIAAAKAELALNLTKNIVDRVIQGYKDISNLR